MESPPPNDDPTGQVGRVTGKIAPGTVGEVVLPIRGGTQPFHAHTTPNKPDLIIPMGTRVIVVDFDPPLTVYVDIFNGVT